MNFRLLLTSLTALLLLNQAPAQTSKDPPTALQAIELARAQTKKTITKLVTLTGSNGTPHPVWSIVFYDPASSSQLSQLDPGEAPEPTEDKYSQGESPAFCNVSRINIDSPAAFAVANKEAAAAKVGFDSINFQLRAQEFSGMPVWTLRLLDADEAIVGIVHLSAETGKLLRTIWLRRDVRAEAPRILDSALNPPKEATLPDQDPKTLPPIENIDPPPAPPQ